MPIISLSKQSHFSFFYFLFLMIEWCCEEYPGEYAAALIDLFSLFFFPLSKPAALIDFMWIGIIFPRKQKQNSSQISQMSSSKDFVFCAHGCRPMALEVHSTSSIPPKWIHTSPFWSTIDHWEYLCLGNIPFISSKFYCRAPIE